MIRLLDRYVLSTFTRLFALTLVAVVPLFMLGDLTDNLDDYLLREDVGAGELIEGYLFSLPQWFQWSLPIAALVATVFTVSRMTANREVLAAKAGGISFYRLFLPMVFGAAVVTGTGFAVADLVPRTNRVAADLLGDAEARTSGAFRDDFTFQTEGGLVLAAGRLSVGDRRLSNVTLFRDDDDGSRLHLDAADGRYTALEGWIFRDGRVRRLAPDGGEATVRFAELRMPALTETPEELMLVQRAADEMTWEEIDRYTGIVEGSGGDSAELRVEAAQRGAIPVATLVIVLFAAPLATTSKRGGAAFGVGLALGSLIFYLLLLNIGGALGTAGLVTPVTAAWLPNAIFLTLGAIFLARVRT